MIVFVRTKHETEELAEKLRARGFTAAAINGDIAQNQRERTIDQLKNGRLDILVATDVAARGLDVDRISHVVNFDIPHDTESYVHRIGRTGRAGRSGEALLFVTPREGRLLRSIERATKSTLHDRREWQRHRSTSCGAPNTAVDERREDCWKTTPPHAPDALLASYDASLPEPLTTRAPRYCSQTEGRRGAFSAARRSCRHRSGPFLPCRRRTSLGSDGPGRGRACHRRRQRRRRGDVRQKFW